MECVLRRCCRCLSLFRSIRKPALLFTLCLAIVSAVSAVADDESATPLPVEYKELARKYGSVIEWQGYFEVNKVGTASGNAQGALQSQSASIDKHSSGRFTLKRDTESGGWEPARGMFAWTGAGEVSANNRVSRAEWSKDGRGSERTETSSGNAKLIDVSFSLGLTKHHASFNNGWPDQTLTQTTSGHVMQHVMDGTGNIALERISLDKVEPGVGGILLPDLSEMAAERVTRQIDLYPQVSGGPGVFNFTAEMPGDQYELVEKQRPLTRSRVLLYPVYEDLEVEITIAGYADWRPLGSIAKPTQPGNHLVARATLKAKNGKTTELPAVKSFKFVLLDTSREPGVCLNWPLAAKDQDYDLRLAAVAAGTLADEDQTLDVTEALQDDKQQPYAESRIDSYDFGGKSELQVTCVLEDGREVIGQMKADDGMQELVRLPKRQVGDWIAARWRNDKKVEKLADDDDDEKVEGQKDNGDGYTLYEEYRGWAEAGRHIEGDPEKKDFFVLNLIGADGLPGIELFDQLSQLRVHAKLRRSEMSETKRLMNGNHLDAPHRVDQHGVWVKAFLDDPKGAKDGKTGKEKLGDSGAATPLTEKGVAGRPGITKGVGILARDNTESVFNQPFNLPAQDSIFAFDRAIAHELLHSVGVEHHGGGDYRQILGYVSPRNPFNKVGRPYYGTAVDKPMGLLDEEGHDVATKDYEAYVKLREFLETVMNRDNALVEEGRKFLAAREGYDIPIKTPQQYVDMTIEVLGIYCFMHLNGIVGVEHGEHSGDQDCLMRYYFAKFYEAKGAKTDTLYVVTPGTERIGMQICRTGKGTGINASAHKPQSRYGDAASDDGNCFSQICPNDAIPPRKVQ